MKNFHLPQYGCDTYVETGTGRGVTLGKAYGAFERCFSVDMDIEMVAAAHARYPNALLSHSLSTEALHHWLEHDLRQEDRVLFFLDAHFPGADFRGARYDVNAPHAVPLREELELIARYRGQCRDYIICDDARIYTLGPFAHGNTEWLQVPGGFDFIHDLFPRACVTLNFDEEGYILIDNRK
jgi:hypothetical protein